MRANFNLDSFFGRACLDFIAAGALNSRLGEVCRMDSLFHNQRILYGFVADVKVYRAIRREHLSFGLFSGTIGGYDSG